MILAMIPSCKGQDLAILGQNSQNLCKNGEKLENIISIHICWWIGTNVCTVVLHSITEHVRYASKLYRSRLHYFEAK